MRHRDPSREDLWREVRELFDFYFERINDATVEQSVAAARRTQDVWVEVQNRFATKDPELLRAVAELLYEATGDVLGELFVHTGTGVDTREWVGYGPRIDEHGNVLPDQPPERRSLWRRLWRSSVARPSAT